MLIIAATAITVGLLLLFGADRVRRERHLINSPLARWLTGPWPIAVGAVLVFFGVVVATYELVDQRERQPGNPSSEVAIARRVAVGPL